MLEKQSLMKAIRIFKIIKAVIQMWLKYIENAGNKEYSKDARLVICICLMLCILKGIFNPFLIDS